MRILAFLQQNIRSAVLTCFSLSLFLAAHPGWCAEAIASQPSTSPALSTAQTRTTPPIGASPVVDLSALKQLDTALPSLTEKPIVYVGEHHNRFGHHTVQLAVLKAMYEQNPNMAIGMEMFQRPFQAALDDFIAGKSGEREMLARTEYFTRWQYDYRLYKPILDFAREKHIPIVALNARRELIEKVAKSGISALSDEERKELPDSLDYSDTAYRDRIKLAFDEHRGGERNFENFLQAQTLWDETMARSVAEHIKANPGRRMLVLAGEGHISFGSGIPKRVRKQNGLAYGILLNDADIERDAGDFIVFPSEPSVQPSPKLMVTLKEANGALLVADLPFDSLAKKAGIQRQDILLSFDGRPLKTISDLKIELLYKNSGDKAVVRISRPWFLFWTEEKEYTIIFP